MKKLCCRLLCAILAMIYASACLGAVSRLDTGTALRGQLKYRNPVKETWIHAELRGKTTQEDTPAEPEVSAYDASLIARTLYGECRGCSQMEQAAVAWCILNRTDDTAQSVEQIVSSPGQFMGYSPANPVEDALYALAEDVLRRHALEKQGQQDVGRVLPKEYRWFSGDGRHNYFRDSYSGGTIWDWRLPDPYFEA